MPPALVGAIAAPVVSGIAGDISASGAQDQANQAAQLALQQYAGITPPDAAALQVALNQQRNAGNLSAINEATMQQGQSALNGYQTDPRLINAQMGALQQMQQLGNTGLTAADRDALLQINNQAAGQAAANRASIMQNMAARGMGGGGA